MNVTKIDDPIFLESTSEDNAILRETLLSLVGIDEDMSSVGKEDVEQESQKGDVVMEGEDLDLEPVKINYCSEGFCLSDEAVMAQSSKHKEDTTSLDPPTLDATSAEDSSNNTRGSAWSYTSPNISPSNRPTTRNIPTMDLSLDFGQKIFPDPALPYSRQVTPPEIPKPWSIADTYENVSAFSLVSFTQEEDLPSFSATEDDTYAAAAKKLPGPSVSPPLLFPKSVTLQVSPPSDLVISSDAFIEKIGKSAPSTKQVINPSDNTTAALLDSQQPSFPPKMPRTLRSARKKNKGGRLLPGASILQNQTNTIGRNKGASKLKTKDKVHTAAVKKKKEYVNKKRTRRPNPTTKQYVKEVKSSDVLMGRGGGSNHHPGNKEYRAYTLSLQNIYKELSKDAKTELSMNVVRWVHDRDGRFLQQDGAGGRFYEVTDQTARQKVSQILREDHSPEGVARKKAKTKNGGIDGKTSTSEVKSPSKPHGRTKPKSRN